MSSSDPNRTVIPIKLYESEAKIYPREVSGYFQKLRRLALLTLLGLYYGLPWLQWGDRQAVLFDLPARKFHIFGLSLWPQDFFFLTLLLIMAGLSLFFFTALAGRVWCGYACPQTVWTDAFIWMERLVEGNRQAQIKLSKQPWNAVKIRKVALKQLLWITFALWTGFTFVGYFTPINELAVLLLTGAASFWQWFWVLFYGFATYGNAGFMREQVCKYMCPYARFQSAMFDKDTLVITYDEKRGEPRTRGTKRKQGSTDIGDCVDCGLCVQVCPTGIDIRDGLQYECIACAACIDVCNTVMTQVKRPPNLIQYTTEANLEGKKTQLLRPRIIIYGVLLAALFVGFVTALAMRSSVQFDVLRDRNALYQIVGDQRVSNSYTLKVMNKGHVDQRYKLLVTDLPAAVIEITNERVITAGEIANVVVRITTPLSALDSKNQTIHLQLTEQIGNSPDSVIEKTRFFSP